MMPRRRFLAAAMGSMGMIPGGYLLHKRLRAETHKPPKNHALMTLAEMRALVDKGRVVVSYKGAVFDVTDFDGHPGGYGRVQMVSGCDLEPFWKVYTQHNRGHVVDCILDLYRIGTLSEADAAYQVKNSPGVVDNPYANQPEPSPHLLTNTRHPYNAEAPLRKLGESWLTPIGMHFVRNHSAVPDVDVTEYTLTVRAGEDTPPMILTLDELKTRFLKVEVTSVIQCNGNRREDFHFLKPDQPAFGPPHWVSGAISNSTWGGVRLRDILQVAGLDADGISLRKVDGPPRGSMVELVGHDSDEVGNQYCCSFPFEKAVDPFGDVLIAYEMNGQPIPKSHGYPVRCIVPGMAGARNCKFLESVAVTRNPCKGHCNWKQYAVHAPDVSLSKLCNFGKHCTELKMDPAVMEMPVQSMISSPGAWDVLAVRTGADGRMKVNVRGLAWGGAGQGINRVDVSLNGGKDFVRANLEEKPIVQRRGSEWSWVFFNKEIDLPQEMQDKLSRGQLVELELCSKALNTSWNVQPETAAPNLNPHGCCVNHWFRVPVTLDPKAKADVQAPDGDFKNKPSGGCFRRPFQHFNDPR